MPKTTDIPDRVLARLDGTTERNGLTVAEVAQQLQEKERTVRDHMDELLRKRQLNRVHGYHEDPKTKRLVGAYRYFKRAAAERRAR